MTNANDNLTYRAAMTELQTIVNRLRDTEDIDVDELVNDVARAKVLVDFCNSKIQRADLAIKTIVGELQVGDAQSQGATPPTPERKK